MERHELEEWIKRHEGFSLFPYEDSVGKLTIGWGYNLSDNGIPVEIANALFEISFNQIVSELCGLTWFVKLPLSVQGAIINMAFNLGLPRLLGFKKMIAALEKGDYKKAALEALDSKWAKQVGQRAKDIALMISEG